MTTWPSIRLDPHDALPLHAQLERALRAWLAKAGAGAQPGAALPDEISLAKKLNVSRHTVRAALAALVRDGLILRRRGQGSVIARPQAPANRMGERFADHLEGATPGSVVATWAAAWATPPDAETAGLLNAPSAVRVIRLDRVRADAQGPLIAQRSWLNPHLRLSGAEDFRRPLYAILAMIDITPATCEDALGAVAADAEVARIFDIRRGLPLLQRKRIVRDREHRVLECALWHHRPGWDDRALTSA
jgi:GntR family transcriptional regulator